MLCVFARYVVYLLSMHLFAVVSLFPASIFFVVIMADWLDSAATQLCWIVVYETLGILA